MLIDKTANGDQMAYYQEHPAKYQNYLDRKEQDRKRKEKKLNKKTAGAFVPMLEQLGQLFKLASLGTAASTSKGVGLLKGMMSTNALKSPGPAASSGAMNPRRNVIAAMNVTRPR